MDASVSVVASRAECNVPERARSQTSRSSERADTPPKRHGEGVRDSPRGEQATQAPRADLWGAHGCDEAKKVRVAFQPRERARFIHYAFT